MSKPVKVVKKVEQKFYEDGSSIETNYAPDPRMVVGYDYVDGEFAPLCGSIEDMLIAEEEQGAEACHWELVSMMHCTVEEEVSTEDSLESLLDAYLNHSITPQQKGN
jgi:hypothetical protein